MTAEIAYEYLAREYLHAGNARRRITSGDAAHSDAVIVRSGYHSGHMVAVVAGNYHVGVGHEVAAAACARRNYRGQVFMVGTHTLVNDGHDDIVGSAGVVVPHFLHIDVYP